MSFGLFVHKFDTSGKLYDGVTSNELNRLATRSYVNSAVSQGAGDYLASVASRLAAQPASPSQGDRHLATATAGDWTENSVFEYDGSAWVETVPTEGTHVYDEDTDESLIYNGSAWVLLVSNLGALKVSSALGEIASAGTESTARSNLGLGSLAVLSSLNLGSSTELQGTLGINRGGTGATTAADARTNLQLGSIATQDASNVSITGGAIANAALVGSGAMSIAGSSVALGGSITADAIAGQISADAISGDQINTGTIDSITISALTTAGISASADLDIGTFDLKAKAFESDVASGTAPLVVASDTLVANLNADKLDGQEGSYYNALANMTGLGSNIASALGNQLDADLANVSASDDTLASAKAIKAYVDAQNAVQDLDFQGDSGGALSIDLATEVLDIAGDGVAISTAGSGNQITISAADATASTKGVASFASADFSVSSGAVSLVDLTVSHMDAAAVVVESEGIGNNDNDTTFPTSAAVKAYVDAEVGASALSVDGDVGTAQSIDLATETLTIAGGTGLTTSTSSLSPNQIGIAIDNTVVTKTGVDTLTNKTLTSPDINGGTLDDAAITLGASGSLDASAGSLTTSAAQNAAIVQGAAANLDIGAFELRAQDLVADSLVEGRVVIAGADGKLVDDADLSFSGDTLTATKIGAFQAAGAINFASQQMTAVDINSGVIDDTAIGLTTPSSGAFTSLSASGSASMSSGLGVAGTTQLAVLNVSGEAALSSTLAVTGESTFSAGLFPASGQDVDLGGLQGSTADTSATELIWFEDSAFSDRSEGSNVYIQAAVDSNTGMNLYTYYKDAAFSVENPSSTLLTTNAPSSWAAYTDNTYSTQITASGGSMNAVILTWTASTYPDAAERAGDGTRWNQVRFVNRYSSISVSSLTWDEANYQARIDFGSTSQLLTASNASSWLASTVNLRNTQIDSPYVEMTFLSDQGLDAAAVSGASFTDSYGNSNTISSVALTSGQTFQITLGSDVSASNQSGSPSLQFSDNDIPSQYLRMKFYDSGYGYTGPTQASDITAIKLGSYHSPVTYAHSSITLSSTVPDSYGTSYFFDVTFNSTPASYNSGDQGFATSGTTDVRYFQDVSAKRAMRIQSIGSNTAPTLNSGVSGDSALYVKQCPVNYSGSHADELFYLDAAGNTVQFTEGGHVFAPRRAMDATEVLAEDADLSSLPTLASSLKECYVFDLSAKAGSPSLGGSSQAQALTLPAPEAADVGREVKFIVLSDMSSANQLTINAGSFTGSGGSFAGQIDGLDSVILSQPYQVVKLLAIKGQDSAATGAITCWKLV